MKKKKIFLSLIIILSFISCSSQDGAESQPDVIPGEEPKLDQGAESQPDVIIEEDNNPEEPSWIPNIAKGFEPWDGNLYFASSEDGLTFSDEKELFLEHAGVPNLLLTSDGLLIATFQYFSFEYENLFGIMAYMVSEDNGETWGDIEVFDIQNSPETHGSSELVDPTIVETEDGSLRLYYTLHKENNEHAGFASATANSIDSNFVYDEDSGLISEEYRLMDPAIVHFDGLWHHLTPLPGAGGKENFHSISEDGINFERVDDIEIDLNFWGNVIKTNDGSLRFYGTRIDNDPGVTDNEVGIAFSEDGYEWVFYEDYRYDGFDPGIIQLEDDSYLLLTTIDEGE